MHEERWRLPVACRKNLVQGSTCNYEHEQENSACSMPAETTPASCKSKACPRRKSCVRNSMASASPMACSMCRRVLSALAGVMPPNSFCPGLSFASSGPIRCTGHVACQRHTCCNLKLRIQPRGAWYLALCAPTASRETTASWLVFPASAQT